MKAAPEPKRETGVLRGLEAARAQRPAREVLREVSWEGPRLDPERTAAREFLAGM